MKNIPGHEGDRHQTPLRLSPRTQIQTLRVCVLGVTRRLLGWLSVERKVVFEVAKEIGPTHARIVRLKILTSRKVIHRIKNFLPFSDNSG
jgi:hypothetical protein